MKYQFTFLFIFSYFFSFSQIPIGYYDSAQGLQGEDLRTALFNIIKDQTQLSYSDLPTYFETTDKKLDGSVWDMYSDVPNGTPPYTFTFGTDKCGSYAKEGDCYNREHSFPASWFNDALPMYSDLFHIYPTDGYVNSKHSNYPFGDVASASWTSQNGSMLGSSADAGYTATVFEPIDEYKGDIARSYLYMITCYKDKVSGWSSDALEGDHLSNWELQTLKKWAAKDTVSQKEIDRNDAVYKIQNNRNPYIDHPEWVSEIWGDTLSGIANTVNSTIKIWYTNNQINISGIKSNNAQMILFDYTGKEIQVLNHIHTTTAINLKNGFYLASIFQDNKNYTLKFIVKE